jgi:hypothetical protein
MAGTGLTLGASLVTGVTGANAGGIYYEVDRTDDSVVTTCTPAPNDCTLRGAVQNANATAVDDAIVFASNLTGSTITLDSGDDLNVTNPLYFFGPGADLLTISGDNDVRIFDIDMTTEGDQFYASGLTLADGMADDGGAIYNVDSNLNLADCTLTGNTATADGGAVKDSGGGGAEGYDNDFVRTAIVNNNAGDDGAGVAGAVSAGYFHNSTISGNVAGGDGGGIWSDQYSYVFDSTISNNMAALGGGVNSLNEYMILNSTILADNTAALGTDAYGTVGAVFSLIENTSGFAFAAGSSNNITGQDPQLGPLALNGGTTPNRLPAATSPVVDKGLREDDGDDDDQREFARPIDVPTIANAAGGDASDIGAVELTLAEAGYTPPGPAVTPPATPPKKKKKCKKGRKLKKGKCVKKKKKKR